MKKVIAAGAALAAALALTACGSGHPPAGPPKAAALAARLGCHVTGPDSFQQASHDTTQYVDAAGGQCETNDLQGIIIITFPSQAKETDWLHDNAARENQGISSDGYAEAVVGRLWVIVNGGFGVFTAGGIIRKLGGKDTSFI